MNEEKRLDRMNLTSPREANFAGGVSQTSGKIAGSSDQR